MNDCEFILNNCLRDRQRENIAKSLSIGLVREENKPVKRKDILSSLSIEKKVLLNGI